MRLLIIRHATAVPRGTPEIPDDQRPLSPEGESKFRKAARGLRKTLDPPHAIFSSPLPRAWRTAEIAAEAWGGMKPHKTNALIGADPRDLAPVLEGQPKDATVAIVGHEPGLSALVAFLLGAAEADRLTFKKGGAALLEVSGPLAEGGRLIWFLPPRVLRDLGR